MSPDDFVQLEVMLNRFNKLLSEIGQGTIKRNSFHAWEIDILVDLENCRLESRRRQEILRQYQRAVARQMETGPGPPMRLSDFLEIRAKRRQAASAMPCG